MSKKRGLVNKKKKKQLKKYSSIGKIQIVDWLDHSSHSGGWLSPKDHDPAVTATTVGRVVYEDDKWLQLAATSSDADEKLGMYMNIVKSCITKRRTLK